MKKIFKTLFSLLVVLGLVSVAVACNKPTKTEEDPSSGGEQQEPAKPNPTEGKEYYVVGGYYDDWNTYSDSNKMTRITVDALDASLKSLLADKKVDAILKYEGRVFNVGPTWTANANIDGEVVTMNGGYTMKVVRAVYDAEDDNTFVDAWVPDPKTAAVQNLTPNTLYMPKWVETPAAGEEGLGTWADNPVVIGGAGEYTVYFIEYSGTNSLESPKYAMAVVKTKELEEPKTTAELIEDEYAALVAGTVTEATEFENVAATVVELETAENADGGYDVKLIASLDEVTFALTFYAEDITGLEKDKEVKFTGSIDHEAAAVEIGDYSEEIVFANATVTWAKVGAPSGIYLKGGMNEWSNTEEGELKYNEDGNPEITVEIAAGTEFKVADADWTVVNLGYADGLDAELVEDAGGNITAKLIDHGKAHPLQTVGAILTAASVGVRQIRSNHIVHTGLLSRFVRLNGGTVQFQYMRPPRFCRKTGKGLGAVPSPFRSFNFPRSAQSPRALRPCSGKDAPRRFAACPPFCRCERSRICRHPANARPCCPT